MKKMQRTLSLALVLIMTLSMFITGCGAPAEPVASSPVPSDSKAPASSQAVEPPKEQVELTFYSVADSQPEMQKICDAATEYLKDKLNVKVKVENFGWGDTYTPKINPMLASGQPVDVIFTSNWAANYRVNANAGYFVDLTPYLKNSPIREIVGDDFLNGSAINGKNYGVPCNKEKVHNWGVLLKKDLVEKYNVDVSKIKTMEDLEPYFDAIKKGEPGVTPLLNVQMEGPFKLLDWDNISDDDIPGALYPDNRDNKIVNQFETPEAVAIYKKMREYYTKGWIHPDGATQDNFSEEMKTGKYFAAVQSMKPGKAEEMKLSTNIDWVQVDMTIPVMSNRETTGALLSIPIGSEHPDVAFKFIEMLYTDKYLKNLFVYGIENEHYTKVSDNVVKLTDNAGYRAGNGWRFGDQFIDYLLDSEDPDKWDQFKAYNDMGIPMNSLGFAFDNITVENEIGAIKNVVQKYYKQLFIGTTDTDTTLAAFSKEMKDAGADVVIAEMQKQYDEWRKAVGK